MSSDLSPSSPAFQSMLDSQKGSFARAWRAFQATQPDGVVPPNPQDWPAAVCSVILEAGSSDMEDPQWSPQQRIMQACSQYTVTLAVMAIHGPWRLNMGHLSISLLLGPRGPVREGPPSPAALRKDSPPARRPPLPALLDTHTPAQLHGLLCNMHAQVSAHGVSLHSTMWALSMALGIDKALSRSHARYGEAKFDHVQLHTQSMVAAAVLVLRDPLPR